MFSPNIINEGDLKGNERGSSQHKSDRETATATKCPNRKQKNKTSSRRKKSKLLWTELNAAGFMHIRFLSFYIVTYQS